MSRTVSPTIHSIKKITAIEVIRYILASRIFPIHIKSSLPVRTYLRKNNCISMRKYQLSSAEQPSGMDQKYVKDQLTDHAPETATDQETNENATSRAMIIPGLYWASKFRKNHFQMHPKYMAGMPQTTIRPTLPL